MTEHLEHWGQPEHKDQAGSKARPEFKAHKVQRVQAEHQGQLEHKDH